METTTFRVLPSRGAPVAGHPLYGVSRRAYGFAPEAYGPGRDVVFPPPISIGSYSSVVRSTT